MKIALPTAVIVAALGYFVDIYDLILFGFVRVKSLKSLGYTGQELTDLGIALQNWQMAGMVIGGLISGILGDRIGRVKLLYWSIAIYSLANIMNGFVHSYWDYALFRFVAGLGLAGELGVGITLVAESMPKHIRGYGTTIVAVTGLAGAVAAGYIDRIFDWRTCYFIGGGLGLLLLALRIRVAESGMFDHAKESQAKRGDFLSIFKRKERFLRYARCLLIGTPTWFVVGVLVVLSPEFGMARGITDIKPGTAIMVCYTGILLGDIVAGVLSQYLRSRVKVMWVFLICSLLSVIYYLYGDFNTAYGMYWAHFFLGLGAGFWVIFVTLGAEQFGTNLRATVATTVPNFARGMLIPISLSFQWLRAPEQYGSVTAAAMILGVACTAIAMLGLIGMEETFDKDLEYLEDDI
jgi:MFS transporter, putative metabolite:H+ symporter